MTICRYNSNIRDQGASIICIPFANACLRVLKVPLKRNQPQSVTLATVLDKAGEHLSTTFQCHHFLIS